MRPFTRQRPIRFSVAAMKSWVVKTSGLWIGPTRTNSIHESLLTHNARMRLMRSIEGDTTPVDKLVTRPCSRHTHRVVIVKHPGMPFRNASRPIIESNRNPFIRDIVRLHLQGPKE